MKEVQKPNDILIATLSAPASTTKDLLQNNINADNTSLLSRDEYKNTPFVKKAFTKDGVFDENAFNNAYTLAEQKYWSLDDDELFDNLANTLEFSPTSVYKPLNAKERDVNYEPTKIKNNPLKQTSSLVGFNELSAPTKTPEEVAQGHAIWDPENKKWLKETAESRNLASKFFGSTLVYAKYDKDGIQENPVTGEVGEHHKGEFITDEDGNYFTELIGNRDLLDKEVVSAWDVITKEDSLANKFDFMDSDGYDKSIGGVAAKVAARSIGYFIPGFNAYYGAATALIGLGSVLPTVYKSLESLITGDNPSAFAKGATGVENWFRKFEQGTSYKGRENFFSIEGIGNLLADTFGQLYQQRAAASLAKFAYKIPDKIETAEEIAKWQKTAQKQAQLGKAMSLGYMGLISAADVYNDALQGGYDRRTAGIASLASMAALFGIMNFNEGVNGLGTWFLDKTTGYDRELLRAPVAKQAKKLYKELEKGVQEALVDKNAGKRAIADTLGRYKVKTLDYLDDIFRIGAEDVWKGMISEGVEEVSEEVVQDTVKGIIDTLSWLGLTGNQGSFGGWNNVFSQEGMSRYLQTFLGGALGGGLFALQNNVLEPAMIRAFKDPNYQSPNKRAMDKDILDLVIAGRGDELVDELNKKTRKIFSNKRAATGYVDADGNVRDLKAEGQTTQADMITQAAIDHVRAMQSFVDECFKHSSPEFEKLRTQEGFDETVSQLFKSTYDGKDVQDYLLGKFKKQLLDTKSARDQWLVANESEKDEKKSEDAISVSSLKKVYEDNIKSLQGFFDGKSFIDSYKEVMLLKDPLFLQNIQGLTLDQFYDTFYKSPTWKTEFSKLPETSKDPTVLTKEKVKSKYELYDKMSIQRTEDALDTLPVYREFLDRMQQMASPSVRAFVDNAHKNAIVKALNLSGKVSEVVEQIIDEMKDNEFFSDEVLKDADPEKKKAAVDRRKEALKNAIKGEATEEDQYLIDIEQLNSKLAQLKSLNLIELIKANPSAFTLAQRLNVDYASQFESKGAIEFTGWNEKQQKILRQMINKEAAQSHLISFNADNIQAIINNVKNGLANTDDFYTQQIIKAGEEEKKSSEESGISGTTLGDITVNTDAIKSKAIEFKELTINNIQDYVKDDEYISKDLYEALYDYQRNQLLEVVKFTTLNPLFADDAPKLTKLISDGDIETAVKILRGSILLEEPTIKFLAEQGITSDKTNCSTLYQKYIESIGKKIKALEDQYNGKIVKNPLQDIADTLYQRVAGTKEGSNLMKYIIQKGIDISTKDLVADTGLFTETELAHIKDVIDTLKLLGVTMYGMQNFDYEKDHRYGYNQAVYDYISAYNQNKSELSKITLIDPQDYGYVTQTFDDLIDRLETITQINSELKASKVAEYKETKTITIKATGMYYKNILGKMHFHVEIDDKDKEVSLISPEILEQEIGDNEEDWLAFNLQCEQNIHKNIRSLLEGKPADKVKTIKESLVKAIHKEFTSGDHYAETALLLKEIMNCSEDSSTISAQYILNKLVGLIDVDVKTIQKKVLDVFAKTSLYPRYDQIVAMEQLLYFLYDKSGNYNVLNREIANSYNENDGLFNKVSLDNLFVLLGAGGSGKTTIVSTVLAALKSDFPEIVALAKNSAKAEDLGKSLSTSGKRIYELGDKASNEKFESLSKQFAEFQKNVYNAIFKYAKNVKTPGTFTDAETTLDGALQYNTTGEKTEVMCHMLDSDSKTDLLTFTITINSIKEPFDSNYVYKFDNYGIDFEKDFTEIKDRSVLVVDEFTQLNQFETHLLSELANKRNSKLVFIGDLNQATYSVDFTDDEGEAQSLGNSPESIMATFANQLQGSWRMANTAQQDNQMKLLAALRLVTAEAITSGDLTTYIPLDSTQSGLSDAIYEVRNSDIEHATTFVYTTNGSGTHKFMGTAITEDETTAQSVVNAIKNSGISTDNPLCVIINDHSEESSATEYFKKLGVAEDNLIFKTLPEIQGAEFDYVAMYKIKAGASKVLDFFKAYTMLTRSKQGSLVIRDKNDIFENTKILHSEETSKVLETDAKTDYSEDVQEYSDLIKSIIDELEDYKPAEEEEKPAPEEKSTPEPPAPIFIEPEAAEETASEEDDSSKKAETPSTHSTISSALKDAGFTSVLPLQTWYYRPGLTVEDVNKLRGFSTEKDLKDFFVKRKKAGIFDEIDYFYYKHPTDYTDGDSLLIAYKKFINEKRTELRIGKLKDIWFVKNTDERTDPLDKWNNDEDLDVSVRVCYAEEYNDGDEIKTMYFTLGSAGFVDSDIDTKENIRNWKNNAVKGTPVHVQIGTTDGEYKSHVGTYRAKDGSESQFKRYLSEDIKLSRVFHLTGNRSFIGKKHTFITDLSYGRYSLVDAKRLGYELVSKAENYVPNFGIGKKARQDAFIKWFNNFNREPINPKDARFKKLLYMADRKWYILQMQGSDEKIAVCPQQCMKLSALLEQKVPFYTIKGIDGAYLRTLAARQMLTGLDQIAGSTLAVQFDKLRNDSKALPKDEKAYMPIKFSDEFETKLKSLLDNIESVLSSNGLSDNAARFKNAIEATLKSKKIESSIVSKLSSRDKDEAWAFINNLRTKEFKKGEKSLDSLISFLDEKLGDKFFYFFDDSIDIMLTGYLHTAYEPANLAIDLENATEVKVKPEEVSTTEPTEDPALAQAKVLVGEINAYFTKPDNKIVLKDGADNLLFDEKGLLTEDVELLFKRLFSLDITTGRPDHAVLIRRLLNPTTWEATIDFINQINSKPELKDNLYVQAFNQILTTWQNPDADWDDSGFLNAFSVLETSDSVFFDSLEDDKIIDKVRENVLKDHYKIKC